MDVKDWKKIDVYSNSVKEHRDLARYVCRLCEDIAWGLGTIHDIDTFYLIGPSIGNKANYQDNIVNIESTGIVILTQTKIEVMSTGYDSDDGVEIFRVGSWIDHISSLQLRAKQGLEQRGAERIRRIKQDEQSRFGKLE